MRRLQVNPDTSDNWSIELPPGDLTLGRGEENGCLIDHPSVSQSHCRISVSTLGVAMEDLGSTSGSFIDGELVERARLRSGQLLRLGDVAMRFESDEPQDQPLGTTHPAKTPVANAVQPTGGAAGSGEFCSFHPRAIGRYTCQGCSRSLCDLCVNTRQVGGATLKFCRSCGGECVLLKRQPTAPGQPARGFLSSLPRAFSYPFRGSGVILLVGGTVFFFVLSHLPLLGFLVTGYFFNYAKSIISTTAEGKEEPPDWPDFTDWKDDILVPYLQLFALIALSFGPAYIIALWQPGDESITRIAYFTALGFGAWLAPMGMLALAMFDTITALNPLALTWSILRVPGHYLIAAAAFELILVIYWLAARPLRELMPVPILPGIISSFLYLYLVAVGMRILGLLYAAHRDELGWFARH